MLGPLNRLYVRDLALRWQYTYQRCYNEERQKTLHSTGGYNLDEKTDTQVLKASLKDSDISPIVQYMQKSVRMNMRAETRKNSIPDRV